MSKMQVVPLSRVKPGFNYRKQEDPEIWKSFVESIRTDGVLVPIEVAAYGDDFMVIAGDRRYRAAKEAKCETVPIIILEGTEADFTRIRLIENVQRADVNPMDEGEEFVRQMKENKDATAATIAESIKKSPAYVLARIRLTTLIEPAKNAIRNRKIPLAYGLILSRIIDKKDQQTMLQQMFDKRGLRMTEREANEETIRHHGIEINAAIFDREPCGTCGSNTLNQQILFMTDEVKKPICMNEKCYREKTEKTLDAIEPYYIEHKQKIIKDVNVAHDLFEKYNAPGISFFGWSKKPKPKTYQANCKKCEHLVFVRGLTKDIKDMKFGEGCMDPKCYRKLTQVRAHGTDVDDPKEQRKQPTSSPLQKQPSGSDRQHAEYMRNRIIVKNVIPIALQNETVRYRLAIYHLVMRMHKDLHVSRGTGDDGSDNIKCLTKFMKEDLGLSYNRMPDDRKIYDAIAKIPKTKVITAFNKLVDLMMFNTEPEVMVATIDELKIKREQFAVDKEYLETFTKGELIEYIKINKNFGHENGIINESERRSTILETVLKQNLAGNLNKAVENLMQ